uniref:Uncharacterized protein n=1 Tax=Trichuris muris TaxID=70415 RepID=A0A5S6R4P2_TRIMR
MPQQRPPLRWATDERRRAAAFKPRTQRAANNRDVPLERRQSALLSFGAKFCGFALRTATPKMRRTQWNDALNEKLRAIKGNSDSGQLEDQLSPWANREVKNAPERLIFRRRLRITRIGGVARLTFVEGTTAPWEQVVAGEHAALDIFATKRNICAAESVFETSVSNGVAILRRGVRARPVGAMACRSRFTTSRGQMVKSKCFRAEQADNRSKRASRW